MADERKHVPVYLPALHHPATIRSYRVLVGDIVKKDQIIGEYQYSVTEKTVDPASGAPNTLRRTVTADLLAPISGEVESLDVRQGGTIKDLK